MPLTAEGGDLDKRTFIERAPTYYALAIAAYFRNSGERSGSESTIQGYYFVTDDEDPGYDRLGNNILFARGALYLERAGFLEISLDDFGPPIFQVRDDFGSVWEKLTEERRLPFFKYQQLGAKSATSWLHEALEAVNEQYARLGMNESDFEVPDNESEPIPLDRDDAELTKAQEALDKTIEGLRADNGYAASVPEERDFVTNELTEAAKKLRADAIVSRGLEGLLVIPRPACAR